MMELWYALVDWLLPFEWADADKLLFMKNALLAVLLISPIFGILGTMIVNNRMAFFSDALGHGAFTGIAIGSFLGFLMPLWAAIFFSIVFSLAITVIKNKSRGSTDTIIGVFSSTAIAIGLVLMSLRSGMGKYSGYLVGDLLSITPLDILMLLGVLVAVIVLWLALFNQMLLVSVNQSLAGSRGIDTLYIDILFTTAIAVIVTVAIQWIGLLLINSLLVLPAAAARNITINIRQYHLASILIAIFSGITGLILSYYLDTSTGATIVLVSALCYFTTLTFKARFA
ncbi:MAG: metal ABC transporter permease [Clostridia bacterium]|nr:metal ABC transporter permease [Clostridia bacterium]